MNPQMQIDEINKLLLCKILAALESPDEAENLLGELCTPQEISTLSRRVAAAELRIQGFTNDQIINMLRREDGTTISSATICRVSEMLRRGKGALKMMVLRANEAEGY